MMEEESKRPKVTEQSIKTPLIPGLINEGDKFGL